MKKLGSNRIHQYFFLKKKIHFGGALSYMWVTRSARKKPSSSVVIWIFLWTVLALDSAAQSISKDFFQCQDLHMFICSRQNDMEILN